MSALSRLTDGVLARGNSRNCPQTDMSEDGDFGLLPNLKRIWPCYFVNPAAPQCLTHRLGESGSLVQTANYRLNL